LFWGPVDSTGGRVCPDPNGFTSGGGTPTIADLDGDGGADVAVVGPCGLVAFRGRDGALLWTADTADTTRASTGASVFDFEGDGRAEVVYGDENELRIFSGLDGSVLFRMCN